MTKEKAIRVYETEFTAAQREGLTVGHAIPGWGGKEGWVSEIKPYQQPCRSCGEPIGPSGSRSSRDSEVWYTCYACQRLGGTPEAASRWIAEKNAEVWKADEQRGKMLAHQARIAEAKVSADG